MKSRLGCFLLGFGTGALTVAAFRRLKEHVGTESYEQVAENVQDQLEQLEARLKGKGGLHIESKSA